MIKRSDLVNAIASTLATIPELPPLVAPVDGIVAYIDHNPGRLSYSKAKYQMQPGQILVGWTETLLREGEMSRWAHRVEICARAGRDQDADDLVSAIVEGVPLPGDGMVWLYCPVLAGCYPTNIVEITRDTDSEGVDFMRILTETLETGDYPRP